jgi:uncharacterized protein YjiS (DUF1127 family)
MMNRTTYTITFAILALFSSVLTNAQSKTTVKATVDRTQILIGEPIQLILEADIPENEPIRFFSLDSIPHFEFLQVDKIDTSDTQRGTRLRQVIRITSFDSGHWVIPALALQENLVTDTLPIDVGFSSPFDPQQPYHDVKDIIEAKQVEQPIDDSWKYYIAAAGLILFVLILWALLRKKKKPVPPPVVQTVDPYEAAMTRLSRLQKQKGDSKYYYTELTDTFRTYVSNKRSIHSLQQITDDLVVQLRDVGLPKDIFDRLSQSLRMSDYVKFAKFVPTPEDDRSSFEVVQQSIEYIEKNSDSPPVIQTGTAGN